MKIAFVGKGGSGKSTISSLFIRYLNDRRGAGVLALDADLNMNLAGLLGVRMPADKHLSAPQNAVALRKFLKGNNQRVRDENAFLPTTPAADGSGIILSVDDPHLAPYAVRVKENPPLSLLTVGTYVAEEIGQACYHTNLFVAENLLTHTIFEKDEWLVADMVAGTDAFSYSLHLQFDAIILIVEPTPESVEVCKLYDGLAKEAGMGQLVHLIANKIEDDEDLNYIRQATGKEPLGFVPSMSQLRKFRQKGGAVEEGMLTDGLCGLFADVYDSALSPSPDAAKRYEMLRELHHKLCLQDWVISGYGGHVAGQYGDLSPLKKAI